MTKFSQFVRSRLAARQSQHATHPDTNLLVAFAEQNLSRGERADVLEHLAMCLECREVVALMSEACGQKIPESPVSAKRGLTGWGWRVAATAAAACLVLITVWRVSLFKVSPQTGAHPANKEVAKPSPPVPAPLVSKRLQPQIEKEYLRPKKKQQKTSSQSKATEVVDSPPVLPVAPASDIAPNLSIPKSTDEVARAAPPIAIEGGAQSSNITSTLAFPPAAQPRTAPDSARANGLVAPNPMFMSTGRAAAVRAFMKPLPEKILWSLDGSTESGAVERSRDGGKTWETIHVDNATKFYALSAMGLNVWVGGAEGNLFHSVDGGASWNLVPVSDKSGRLAGSITMIEVSGVASTKVRANSGESWVTNDSGLHWRRQ